MLVLIRIFNVLFWIMFIYMFYCIVFKLPKLIREVENATYLHKTEIKKINKKLKQLENIK